MEAKTIIAIALVAVIPPKDAAHGPNGPWAFYPI